MAKKSRKRNRKILGLLAAGLGAAALMKGRGKGAVSTEGQTPPIGGTDHIPVAPTKVVADTGNTGSNTSSNFQTRFKARGNDNVWRGPLEHKRYMDSTAGNRVPPSMRGGAETAQGFVRKVPISRTGRGRSGVTYGWSTTPYKKGGRVGCGKAKRGFGRALKKGRK